MDHIQQGVMGQVDVVNHHGIQCVSKKPVLVDYSIELEMDVLLKLQTLNSRHFPLLIDYNLESEPTIYMQYIDSLPLSMVVSVMNTAQLTSMNGMILAIASIANEAGIVHHDLHGRNVLLKDTDVDVNRYIFPDGQVLEYKTYGMEPVLIDYGQSFDGTSRIGFGLSQSGIFPDNDCLVESRRVIPSLFSSDYFDEHGFFKDGIFHDILDEYSKQNGGKLSEMLDLLSCKINLSSCSGEMDDGLFNECIHTLQNINLPDKERLMFIKKCLDLDLKSVYNMYYETYTLMEVAAIWNSCHTAVKLLNIVLTKYLQTSIKLKRKIYKTCRFKSNRQVAQHLMTDVVFDRPYSVRSYDVATKTTKINIC